MKIYLLIALLLIVTKLLGQVDDEIIDFQKLTGFDSVLVVDEAGKVIHAYNYRHNALLRERNFYNGKLTRIVNYWTLDERRVIQTHTKWTTYSENMEQIGESWGDTYGVDVTTITHDIIIRKEHYESTGTDSTLQERIIPTYDANGRLVTEKIYDYSTGLRNVFESNSAEFGKRNVKTETLEKIKQYLYEPNKITIKYMINEEVTGIEVVELNGLDKPARFVFLSSDSKKLGETILAYDLKGRITERKSAWYIGKDLWGDSVDFTGPVREKIFYNTSGLPEKINVLPTGQVASTSTYNYYQ